MADDMVELEEATNAPHEIEVRGTRFEIRSLTWGDRIKIQKRLGKPFGEVEYGNPQDLVVVIHTMLARADKALTEAAVAEMFDADNETQLQELWAFAILDQKTAADQLGKVRRAMERLAQEEIELPTAGRP